MNCCMVTIAGPNKSKYSTRIGCKATQSNTKCRSSPTECEAQYEQRRRCLGTPDRLPRTIGKEWQPILNRKKTLIHRELIANCKSDFGRRTPEGLANHRRYVQGHPPAKPCTHGHMSTSHESCGPRPRAPTHTHAPTPRAGTGSESPARAPRRRRTRPATVSPPWSLGPGPRGPPPPPGRQVAGRPTGVQAPGLPASGGGRCVCR